MCEFCVKHGEGEKWYLRAKNYSNDLLSDISRRRFVKDFFYWIDRAYVYKFPALKALPYNVPVIGDMFKWLVRTYFKSEHWGQVVPIEEVEKILSITNSITRIPCICRAVTTGKERRVCFLICLDPKKLGLADIVDRSYFKGPDVSRFETVDKKWAVDFIRESETKGMIHTIWTFKAPFIGGLCNCDRSDGCIPMKMYKDAIPITFRAEYVALVNEDSCVGCRECIKVCQFNAIEHDSKNNKVTIGAKKCYGCGICRSVCKANAVVMKDRHLVPEASFI